MKKVFLFFESHADFSPVSLGVYPERKEGDEVIIIKSLSL